MKARIQHFELHLRGTWLAIGWALIAAVIGVSLAPPLAGLAPEVDQLDKFGHVVAYAVLMYWFMQIVARRSARILVAAGLILMGASLEGVQATLPYRTFESLDALANALGVLLGWVAAPPRTGNVLMGIEALIRR